MATTRLDINQVTPLDVMQALEKKTRELVPFSENQSGGDQLKKKILLFFTRRKQHRASKLYYQLKLNPSVMCHQDTAFTIQKNNQTKFQKSLIGIFKHISSLPERELKRHNGQIKSSLEAIENLAKNAVRHGVGNCMELASLLILLVREIPLPSHVTIFCELLTIQERGDHVFVIANRDPKSDLNDLSTWGLDAIICDPWFRETVNVSEQLQLPENKRANILSFLSLYQKEKWDVVYSTHANEAYPHSVYWYNKRPAINYFIKRQPNLIYSNHELEQPYPISLVLIKRKHVDLFKVLVSKKIALDKITYLNVPLIFYALEGSIEIVKVLLENKIDPNVQLSTGLTPLLWAARQPDQKELTTLLTTHIKDKATLVLEDDNIENRENQSSDSRVRMAIHS